MKTYRKIIAILLAVGLVLPGAGLVAMADTVEKNVTRLSGETRYETAVAVSEETYKGTADAVVLAGGMAEVDALTGTLLAAAKNAPLLYTHKDTLTPVTKARIAELKAKTVYILGGENVVSEDVENELKALDLTVVRVSGKDRYETAAEVAKKSETTSDHAFIVVDGVNSALVDALAIGPVSHVQKDPVLLVSTNSVPAATEKALKDLGIKTFTVIGGENAVSKTVETELKKLATLRTRVAGDNRDETAIAIATRYFPKAEESVVVNGFGTYLADALVGGYLGGMKKAPILYARTNALTVKSAAYLVGFNKSYLLGGKTVASVALENEVEEILAPLKVESVTAITKTVGREDAVLEFAINGQTVAPDALTMKKLEDLGYTFEFLANATVFTGTENTNTSIDGKLANDHNKDKFNYQVKAKLDGDQVALSQVTEVKVLTLDELVSEIKEVNVMLDGTKLANNKVGLEDASLVLEVTGKTKDMTAKADAKTLTNTNLKFASSKHSIATVETDGTITLNGAVGNVTLTVTGEGVSKTITLSVTNEERVVSPTNTTVSTKSIKNATGQEVEFTVVAKDNFGELITDATITFDSAGVVTSTRVEDEKNLGTYTVTATLGTDVKDATNVDLKVNDVKVATLKVTVVEAGATTSYVVTSEKDELDLFVADNKTTDVKVTEKDKNGYTVEVHTLASEDDYIIRVADDKIVKVTADKKLEAVKVGSTKVTVFEKDGATEINRGTFTVKVVNTVPTLEKASFAKFNKVVESGDVVAIDKLVSSFTLQGTGKYDDIKKLSYSIENDRVIIKALEETVGSIIVTTSTSQLKAEFSGDQLTVTGDYTNGVKADIELTLVDANGKILDEAIVEVVIPKP